MPAPSLDLTCAPRLSEVQRVPDREPSARVGLAPNLPFCTGSGPSLDVYVTLPDSADIPGIVELAAVVKH